MRQGHADSFSPINRFEGYAGFLNSVTEALDIVDELGTEQVGVLGDLFHMNIEDGAVPDTLRVAGRRLWQIHLADSNRQAPGTGHLDFLEILRVLDDIGFQGYLSLDSVPPLPDWKTVVRESIRFMKQMEQAVDLQRHILKERRSGRSAQTVP